jgi:D-threo-aldose 1-dehydrogenase
VGGAGAIEGADDVKLMLLHPDDNVLVCTAPIEADERLALNGEELRAAQAVDVGHKLARRAIAAGETILKYGAPIGSATRAIAPGEWVHVHNMKSDYIPTHDRHTVSGGAA